MNALVVVVALGRVHAPCGGVFALSFAVGGARKGFCQRTVLYLAGDVVVGAAREANDGAV